MQTKQEQTRLLRVQAGGWWFASGRVGLVWPARRCAGAVVGQVKGSGLRQQTLELFGALNSFDRGPTSRGLLAEFSSSRLHGPSFLRLPGEERCIGRQGVPVRLDVLSYSASSVCHSWHFTLQNTFQGIRYSTYSSERCSRSEAPEKMYGVSGQNAIAPDRVVSMTRYSSVPTVPTVHHLSQGKCPLQPFHSW